MIFAMTSYLPTTTLQLFFLCIIALVLRLKVMPVLSDAEEYLVIAVGLPKSGSTSLTKFLNNCCSGLRAIHWTAPNCSRVRYPVEAVRFKSSNASWNVVRQQRRCFIGVLIQQALADKKPPLEYVFETGVSGVVQMDTTLGRLNIWPQIDALELILDAYPQAHFVHHIRSVSDHVASIIAWGDFAQQLRRKGMLTRFAGQHALKSDEENISIFILAAREMVRNAFESRRDARYIEVDIAGNADAGAQLSTFLGSRVLHSFPHANRNSVRSKYNSSCANKPVC